MTSPSSTVANLEFKLRVRRRRATLRLSGDFVAKELSFSRNHWSAIENGRSLIAREKLEQLFELFEFTDEDREELAALDAASRSAGWWVEALGDTNPIGAELCGLEDGATAIRAFETLTIPGLFQTPDYTRAVISKDPIVGQLDLNRLVEVRRRRQARLTGQRPLEFSVVLPQAALLHQVAGPELQMNQLSYMKDLCERHDHITLRVVPLERHPGILSNASTLLLLDFKSVHLPTLAWQEAFNAVGPIDKVREVERIELAWADAVRTSLSPTESLDRVEEIIQMLRNQPT